MKSNQKVQKITKKHEQKFINIKKKIFKNFKPPKKKVPFYVKKTLLV